ncbi:hypothetical protein [Methylocystis parvus]
MQPDFGFAAGLRHARAALRRPIDPPARASLAARNGGTRAA